LGGVPASGGATLARATGAANNARTAAAEVNFNIEGILLVDPSRALLESAITLGPPKQLAKMAKMKSA
jgi:hypothetical protein